MKSRSNTQPTGDRRARLREIAASTLDTIERGSYTLDDVTHPLAPSIASSVHKTRFYAPDSLLSIWSPSSPPTSSQVPTPTIFSILEITTLQGARFLRTQTPSSSDKIGVLNFASAKKPGGGFINGAQAQEESIARSSTLYPSLMSPPGQEFYKLHHSLKNNDGNGGDVGQKGGYYTHAMIYSPNVIFFRADDGELEVPLEVEIVTSAAVNAGVVRRAQFGRAGGQAEEERIARAMKERMARILFLFEQQGVRNLVLGSFGTGVFRNNVRTVARIWRELLRESDARFEKSFERVVFAIIGTQTFEDFKDKFQKAV